MKNKTKSMFALFFVLIIGFVLGALSSGAVRHQKGERITRMSPEEQFSEVMEKIIQPTETQKAAISQILKRKSERIASIQQQRSKEFFAVFDSFRKEMDAILTSQQKEKLETHMQKTRKKFEEMEVERMSRVLDLNEAQRKQLSDIFKKQPMHKPGGPPPSGEMEDIDHMQKGMESFDAEVEKILTPEQIEKFKEFRSRKPEPFDKPMMPDMKKEKF